MQRPIIRLDQLIDDQAEIYREKVAIKYDLNTFNYREVNEISNQLAQFFTSKNIGAGDVVAVSADRSAEIVITLLAIIKSGATYLPIDNNLPADRINYMLNDSSAKVLLTSNKSPALNQMTAPLLFIEDAWQAYSNFSPQNSDRNILNDGIAYILYTSGSTGKPKGVEVKHSGLLNLLLSVQQDPGMCDQDVMLATTTISFDIAELELFLPLISGGTLVMANSEAVRDGRMLIDLVKAENATILQGTPFMWRTMLEAGWNEVLPIKVFCGGEAMTKDLAFKLLNRSKAVWNMYGPTETTIYSIIKKVTLDDEIITIGKPINNTFVYLIDEHFKEVPQGAIGEICIGGDGVSRGYLNNPKLTAEKFVKDTFSGREGMLYRTGDLGRLLENGDIHCLGRIDHQIKIRGFRVETEEIEYQLKAQPVVKDAIVALFKDALENMHLIAYVVCHSEFDEADTAKEINIWKTKLRNVLPEYMVPDNFMVIPFIPLMNNGKLDRKALPDPVILASSLVDYEAPETETERLLTEISLKNIALSKIGVTDNFFELGIDSLVALKIMIQVEKHFGKRIPVSTLISHPTIRLLASLIDNNSDNLPYKSLVTMQSEGTKTPFYIVHGIGLNILNLYGMVSHLAPDQPVYGLQALGLDGKMEPLDKMEDIAKSYIEEIITHNPSGPYAIGGYSFGGYIAFEMARQLKAMGKEVTLLAMFDTNIQIPTHQYSLGKKIGIKAVRQLYKLRFRIATTVSYPILTAQYLKAYYSNKFNFSSWNPESMADFDAENLPGFMQDIVKKLTKAFDSYVIQPSEVKVDLFKAGTRMYFVDDPYSLGWSKYALMGVSIHNIPGDHKEIFSPPNDRVLAEELQKALDKGK